MLDDISRGGNHIQFPFFLCSHGQQDQESEEEEEEEQQQNSRVELQPGSTSQPVLRSSNQKQ